ncbi:MAG TPA: hypothetical protein VFW87_12415 [Pirellulales bacterium]|nr:hypothetical protein [Pirellulales bacterium]
MTFDAQLEAKLQQLGREWPPDQNLTQAVMRAIEGEAAGRRPARKRRWSRRLPLGLAACLALCAAGTAALFVFSSPGTTLAQIQAAARRQPWLHGIADNGDELWVSSSDGKIYLKEAGRIQMFDRARHVWMQYRADTDELTATAAPDELQKKLPRWSPTSIWDLTVEAWKTRAREENSPFVLRQETVKEGGRELIRIDVYRSDALGGERLEEQLWADTQTRLPVRSMRVMPPRGDDRSEKIVSMRYEFPPAGPADVYEAGVPRTAKLIETKFPAADSLASLPEDLQEVLQAARRAWTAFPRRYRAVIWKAEADPLNPSSIDLIYWEGLPQQRTKQFTTFLDWSGVKIHQARYWSLMESEPAFHLPPTDSADEVLLWLARQTPGQLDISDGVTMYSRQGPALPPVVNPMPTTLRVQRINTGPTLSMIWFSRDPWLLLNQWPLVDRMDHLELVAEPEQTVPGTVALRRIVRDSREDYYLSPARDYLCVKRVFWQQKQGTWQKWREVDLSELKLLPTGHWCVSQRRTRAYPRHPTPRFTDWIDQIDIQVLAEDELPAGVFDGQRLVREAQEEGHKVEAE